MAGACTVQIPSSAPATTVAPVAAAAAPTTAVPTSVTDAAYVASLISQDSGFAGVDPSVLIGTAKAICDNLSVGKSVGDVAAILWSSVKGSSVTASDAGFLFSAGVGAYCPQFNAAVSTWANSNG